MTENTIYKIVDGGFEANQAKKRMNRALYGRYYEKEGGRLRILSGELPELLLFHKKDRGRVFFQFQYQGTEKSLSSAAHIRMNYKEGRVCHIIEDEAFVGGKLQMETIPDITGHGAVIKLVWNGQEPLELTALVGCVSGMESGRAMDAGYTSQTDPNGNILYQSKNTEQSEFAWIDRGVGVRRRDETEDGFYAWMIGSNFQKKGECSGVERQGWFSVEKTDPERKLAYLIFSCQPKVPVWLWFGCEETAPGSNLVTELQERFQDAVNHYKMISERMKLDTPSEVLNALTSAACVAAEGYWLDPVFAHGAWSWDLPLMGWRSMYGPAILGMEDRIWKEAALFTGLQLDKQGNCVDESLKKEILCGKRFQTGMTYFHKQNEANEKKNKEEKEKGVPDDAWQFARQSPESVFVSEGMMPYMPTALGVPMYNMQEVFIDQILYTFEKTGDREKIKELFPAIERHLNWEERCFDHDYNGLYENYANFWASDGVYSAGAAGAIATAYNYRANKSMAKYADWLGRNSHIFKKRTENIFSSFQDTLWENEKGKLVEWKDRMGEGLCHMSTSIPSMVHAAESGVLSKEQIRRMLEASERELERIEVPGGKLIWNTNWVPYAWSVRDVDFADLFHLAMIYFQNGQPQKGFEILNGAAVYSSCNMVSPGALMCVLEGKSVDFSDTVSMYIRCIYEGLFGIEDHVDEGIIQVVPHFPDQWDHASIETSRIGYSYRREGNREDIHFKTAQCADVIVRLENRYEGVKTLQVNETAYAYESESEGDQEWIQIRLPGGMTEGDIHIWYTGKRKQRTEQWNDPQYRENLPEISTILPDVKGVKQKRIPMEHIFNDTVCEIYRHKYLSPRTDTCSLQVPYHLVPADWCVVNTGEVEDMNDEYLRSHIQNGVFEIPGGLTFLQPKTGFNIAYVSKWDYYPDQMEIPVEENGKILYLMMAVYTNQMQCDVPNASVKTRYEDGSMEQFDLIAPLHLRSMEKGPETERAVDQWCYGKQKVDRIRIGSKDREPERVKGGIYAQVIGIPLKEKKVNTVSIWARANEVVIGVMGVTLV